MSGRSIFHIVGLMSGSSLDGADLACCRFELTPEMETTPVQAWELCAAETIPFPGEWRERLRRLPAADGATYVRTDAALGHYFGRIVRSFIERHQLEVDAVASHGHTIFHFPEAGATAQIGCGSAIAAETGLTTIDRFRSLDLALGGQGAPLAPIADRYLFPQYDLWLNLGGIANLTVRRGNEMIAFDVGGANQVLNAMVAPLGLEYDAEGRLARSGRLIPGLLQKVDALPYFQASYPKSLGNDWVQQTLLPLYLEWDAPAEDKLCTAVVQLARQIARDLDHVLERPRPSDRTYRLLATGGGALNTFLMECIQEECAKICSLVVVVPDLEIVQYKEAALMALMGALRLAGLPNCLHSVTGASRDAVGGSVFLML